MPIPYSGFGSNYNYGRKAAENQFQMPSFGTDALRYASSQVGQKEYLTPAEIARIQQDITRVPMRNLEAGYNQRLGEGQGSIVNDFNARGMGFGGNLSGNLARFQGGLGQEFLRGSANIQDNAATMLGQESLSMGFQNSQHAMDFIDNILRQIIGGQYGVQQARAGQPKGPGIGQVIGQGLGTAAAFLPFFFRQSGQTGDLNFGNSAAAAGGSNDWFNGVPGGHF